ncbi:lysylphosphatidylglycerol synthase transmembrane domain-containing protein [Paraflavitalea pollutisoli]|uniref:lysylphosphatidylglycerol synthase transmembrane domain-containing protein n=1 Tax=Paraflavitalea pollutisoli TaxID=3034143 RepID=UPI0023EBB330|nr:lysylphosphatidylglycerol synthase transmembrane domain-containing protein [Paraflavitalea sp. H1-2-19X]
MNKKIVSYLQYALFLGLAIFLVWWSISKIPATEWDNIKLAISKARYWLIIPVMGALLLSHYSRAIRWKILMEPLGYKPRTSNTYLAVLIGYLANLAFPRLGEVLKCTVLARYEKVPADKLVGTIVAERAVDVICLAVVITLATLSQLDVIGGFVGTQVNSIIESKAALFTPGKIIMMVIALLVLIGGAIFVFKKFSHIGIIQKIKKIVAGVWGGVTSIRYVKKKGWFIFHSIFIWAMYLVSTWIGLYSLEETSIYGIKEALSVLSTGSLAMIMPTPGGLGVYHIFVQQTLILYGTNDGIALAFGLLMWTVQFFQMLISGFVALALLPIFNKTQKASYAQSGHHTQQDLHTTRVEQKDRPVAPDR